MSIHSTSGSPCPQLKAFAQGVMESLPLPPLRPGASVDEAGAGHPGHTSVDEFMPGGSRPGPVLALAAVDSRGSPPDSAFDGAFVGAGGRTWPPNTPLSEVEGVRPSNGATPNGTVVYINGINTSKEAQFASLQKIADTLGATAIGLHNATEGAIKDLWQSLGDKLDKGRNPAVDSLADMLYDELRAGRGVNLLAHSQGGLIVSRALEDLKNRLQLEDGLSQGEAEQAMAGISVVTTGAAARSYVDGPRYEHHVNRFDPVPSLVGLGAVANPLTQPGRGAEVNRFSEFHLNPIASHSFDGVYLGKLRPLTPAQTG